MILVNSVGAMIFMSSIKDSFDGKDVAAEPSCARVCRWRIACPPYFRSGLSDPEKMKLAAREILGSTFFRAVDDPGRQGLTGQGTDRGQALSGAGGRVDHAPPGHREQGRSSVSTPLISVIRWWDLGQKTKDYFYAAPLM